MSAAPKMDLQYIDDDMEIRSVFKSMLQNKEKLWVWQKTPGRSGKRPVHFGVLRRMDALKSVAEIKPNNSGGFKFESNEDIFIYSSSRNLACKVTVRERTPECISFALPKRMNRLDGDMLKGLALVEKEDEDRHKHLRQLPRTVVKRDQMVSVHRPTTNVHSIYLLHDMSAGGMGFKVDDPAEFDIGETVEVLGIDGKSLPKKISGQVVAIRQMEDGRTFKVGVKFNAD